MAEMRNCQNPGGSEQLPQDDVYETDIRQDADDEALKKLKSIEDLRTVCTQIASKCGLTCMLTGHDSGRKMGSPQSAGMF